MAIVVRPASELAQISRKVNETNHQLSIKEGTQFALNSVPMRGQCVSFSPENEKEALDKLATFVCGKKGVYD